MMEDFISVDSDVAIIQKATDDDTVNSIIEEKGRNSGNEQKEEEHMTEEVHKCCNFLEEIYDVHTTTLSRYE
jgi:hypothetical protein